MCSERHFSMCFFQVRYKRTQNPWKDSSQRFSNNQVGDKVIILLQGNIHIGSIDMKGTLNQRLQV
jgi:hypothetical protein